METKFREVFRCLERADFKRADNIMLHICNSFMSDATIIDANIDHFFGHDFGVFPYLKKVLFVTKTSQLQSIPECFKVIYMLLNNFSKQLEDHYEIILKLCDITLSQGTANKLKEHIAEILHVLVSPDKCKLIEAHLLQVYGRLKDWLARPKVTSGLQGELIQTLATIAQHELFQFKLEEITHIFFCYFGNVDKNKPGFQQLLHGGYTALDSFMKLNDAVISGKDLLVLYNFLKRDAKFIPGYQRFGSHRCIQFFIDNAGKFALLIPHDAQFWTALLEEWFKLDSKKDSQLGFAAIAALYKQLSVDWITSGAPAYFKEVINKFTKTLGGHFSDVENVESNHKETHLAIRCLGYLAPVCLQKLSQKEFQDLFVHLIQHVEHFVLVQQHDKLSDIFADYIEAVSHFLKALSSGRAHHVSTFKTVTIMIIKAFPNVPPNRHEMVISTLFTIFACLKQCSLEVFHEFIEDVVRQGILWTCSHALAQQVEILNVPQVTYKNYLPLWLGLLKRKERDEVDIVILIGDTLLKNLIYMSSKLNFTLKQTDCTGGNDLEPEVAEDFKIFANITEFYCDLLREFPGVIFRLWVDTLLSNLIKKSVHNSLVSGFYKLLAQCFETADNLDYFNGERLREKEHVNTTAEDAKNYVEIVLKRVNQYDNELHFAALSLILHTPSSIVSMINYDFSSPVISALRHGHANYQLATVALTALERWHDELDVEFNLPILKKVVPFFDAYLRNQFLLGDKYEVQGRKLKKWTQRRLAIESEPELLQLQHKILKFLAVIPSDACMQLVNIDHLKLHWSESNLLKVKLSLAGQNVNLYLDTFLDRILELCLECSDRKIRITACEMLHSTVVVFLGTSKMNSSSDLERIFNEVLHVVLKLSCDLDHTVQALFAPLILQMTHWYAHPTQIGSTLSQDFIKILLDGVASEYGGAVRVQAGKLLREFVAWTRKQNSKTSLKNHLNNVQLIVDNMVQFALHSDEVKRLGATVIFNSIYRELREEDAFVDKFLLQILYGFTVSLTFINTHEVDADLLGQTNFCLEKTLDCLLRKQSLFERVRNDESRPTPPKFTNNKMDGIISFVFQHTWHLNMHCRTTCIEMFKKFPSDLQVNAMDSIDLELFKHDLLPNLNTCNSCDDVLRFYASLMCFIDGHLFVIAMNDSIDFTDSVLWSILDYFLEYLQCRNLEEVLECCHISSASLRRKTKEEFAYLRMNLIERILNLFDSLLLHECTDFVNQHFLLFLKNYLFNSASLGLLNEPNEIWSERVSRLLNLYTGMLKVNNDIFTLMCKDYIVTKLLTHLTLEINIPLDQRQLIRGMIKIQGTALDANINVALLMPQPITEFYNLVQTELQAHQSSTSIIPELKATLHEYFNLKLKFSLDRHDEDEYNTLITHLCHQNTIYSNKFNAQMELGFFIFLTFKTTILEYTANETYLYKILHRLLGGVPAPMAIRYYIEYTKYILKDKHLSRDLVVRNEMVKITNYLWQIVSTSVDNETAMDLVKDFYVFMDEATKSLILCEIVKYFDIRKQSDLQQMKYFAELALVLGMVAPNGENDLVDKVLKNMRKKYSKVIGGTTMKISTTLLIKNLFVASTFGHSFTCFFHGIEMLVTVPNDFNVDDAFCQEFVRKMPIEMQNEFFDIFMRVASDPHKTQQRRTQVSQILCKMLGYCTYEIFEAFFARQICTILSAFAPGNLNLEARMLSCIFLNCLFANIRTENFENCTCKITKAFCQDVKTGKELLKQSAMILLNVCKEIKDDFINYDNETFRKYQCHAYNALATLVCNCLTGNVDYYVRLFQRRGADDEDILWSKLVSWEEPYNFQITVDKIPAKKKLFVQIRSNQSESKPDVSNYIASQSLFLSTLAEDITNYDFAGIMVRSDGDKSPGVRSWVDVEVSQEDINQHECMAQICGVIKHMSEMDMLPDTPPAWCLDLASILYKETMPPNVRQFICKVVENSQEYLKQYAPLFTIGIIRTVCQCCARLDAFATDMIVMLLTTWSHYIPTKYEASELVRFVMQNVWVERSDMFAYYLSLLKAIVESYRNFDVPYELIEDGFNADVQAKSNLAAIHFINILLINGVSPFQAKISKLCKRLVDVLDNADKKIYVAAAETIGLVLIALEEQSHPSLPQFTNLVQQKLESFQNVDSTNKFIHVLEGVIKQHPAFGREYVQRILLLVNSLNSDNCKVLYLKIFIKCSHVLCDNNIVKHLDLMTWLGSTNLDIQIVTLQIILQVIHYLEPQKLQEVIKYIQVLKNDNSVFRSIFTDILIATYHEYCNSTDPLCVDIITNVSQQLVAGFLDSEPEIRQKVCAFWESNQTIPPALHEKLVYILETMYDNANEEIFLPFVNFLLLQGFHDGEDEPLFGAPLQRCDFNDYEINAHWREQFASMLPMFTQASGQEWYLRATQSYTEFDATQSLASQKQSFLEGASSLAYASVPTFKKPFVPAPSAESGVPQVTHAEHKLKKMRFLTNKDDISKMYAGREIAKTNKIVTMRQNVKKQREAQARIYRKYRHGDFPDIQIGVSAVVNPLRELIKHDGPMASLLCKNLFDAAIENAPEEEFLQRINNGFDRIFRTSSFNPILIGCLLQISYEYRKSLRFDANVISNVANNTGLISLGCLLIEEYILQCPDDGEAAHKKGVGVSLSPQDKHWVKLAELYKNLYNWDAVYGIFQDKMPCPAEAALAIEAESENRWSIAKDYYKDLIGTDYNIHRKDFYYDAFFKCCEELSDWETIRTNCMHVQTPGKSIFEDLMSSEWNKQTLLPYYVKSYVRQPELYQFEEKFRVAMNDVVIKEHFQEEFPGECCLFYLNVGKLSAAKTWGELHAKNFLRDWQCVKPLYNFVRSELLTHVTNSVEITTLLAIYDDIQEDCVDGGINRLLNGLWRSSQNDGAISLKQREVRHFYRTAFNALLRMKLCSLRLESNKHERLLDMINMMGFKSELSLMQEALKQKNLKIASKHLKVKDAQGRTSPHSCLLFSEAALIKAETAVESTNLFVEAFKGYFKCVNTTQFNNDFELNLNASLHLMKLCQATYDASMKYDLNINKFKPFATAFEICEFSDLLNFSYENMRQTLYRLEDRTKYTSNFGSLAKPYLQLAKSVRARGIGYENNYIEYSLKSMQYGSEEAQLLFPNLLEVEGLLSVHKAQFLRQASQVPIWMFIRWIPHILAYVDTPKVALIKEIVINLAKEYPNSLIYAYKLSKEKYTYENEETAQVTNSLDELLHNPLVDKMLSALRYVCMPSILFRIIISKLKKAATNESMFKSVAQTLFNQLFDDQNDDASIDPIKGSMFKFIEKKKLEFLSIIKSNASVDAILKKIEEMQIDNVKPSTALVDYSPWLKYFHASDYECEIEVPGQYSGICKPLPQYHPKISTFSADVKVFHSNKMPVGISIHANNIKVYRFLVKYGEDLRQDQRIQQLFKLMNVMLSGDAKCHERKLQISTFEVIPLTSDLGFIQWVDETEVLKDLYTNWSGYKTLNVKMNQAWKNYTSWMNKAGSGDKVENYFKAVVKYNKEQTTINYNQQVNSFPWDILRKAFWNIASDAETFFALRHNFIQSYATMCACNWLVGIGDRHLQNILVSRRNGEVIGIDFGHAFGSATQQQRVPELVPFRLTPQILNLMAPLKESGLLQQTMAHVLRALRANSELLIATMNIFVLEPTLDWCDFAGEWNADVIMELVQAKMAGRHPALITMKELQLRTCDTPEVNNAYVDCIRQFLNAHDYGDAERALGVNEQAKCLIAQATEPNLLGRLWHGWEPWL